MWSEHNGRDHSLLRKLRQLVLGKVCPACGLLYGPGVHQCDDIRLAVMEAERIVLAARKEGPQCS
ncbi:MAG: hypothetical protein WD533_06585 [Dehalococcoidia bacterium]